MRPMQQTVIGVGVGAWLPVDRHPDSEIGYGVRLSGPVTSYHVEYTYENVLAGPVVGPFFKAQDAQSTNKDGSIAHPIAAIRLNVASVLGAATQTAPSTATTGGTLAAGTYYYVVVAFNAAGDAVKSNEMSQTTTGATSTVTVNWNAVAGATGYKIYRGTAPGAQTVFFSVGAVTTFTDTGGAGTAGTPNNNAPSATMDVLQGVKG